MLTTAQQATLKAFIAADGTLNAKPNNTDGASTIAKAINLVAVPDHIVWRTDIPSAQLIEAVVGTEYAALVAIKQNLMTLMLSPGLVNASAANIRANFSAIFSAGATLTALTAVAKRQATVVEKVLATGTGTTAVPATMGFVGAIGFEDVQIARAS